MNKVIKLDFNYIKIHFKDVFSISNIILQKKQQKITYM